MHTNLKCSPLFFNFHNLKMQSNVLKRKKQRFKSKVLESKFLQQRMPDPNLRILILNSDTEYSTGRSRSGFGNCIVD